MSDARYQQAQGSRPGRLAAPGASARLDNPLCGDRIALDIQLDGDVAVPATWPALAAALASG